MKKKKFIKVAQEFKGIKLPTGNEITHFPFEAPWINGLGACLINIVGLRKNNNAFEAQIADEQGIPYRDNDNNYIWVNIKDFHNEWPQ